MHSLETIKYMNSPEYQELKKMESIINQQESGYHPHGYGFYSLSVDGGVTTWNCSNSCD